MTEHRDGGFMDDGDRDGGFMNGGQRRRLHGRRTETEASWTEDRNGGVMDGKIKKRENKIKLLILILKK